MLVDYEPPLNHDVHTNIGSLVLDSVWHSKEKDAGKDVQIKAISYSDATVISYELYEEVNL